MKSGALVMEQQDESEKKHFRVLQCPSQFSFCTAPCRPYPRTAGHSGGRLQARGERTGYERGHHSHQAEQRYLPQYWCLLSLICHKVNSPEHCMNKIHWRLMWALQNEMATATAYKALHEKNSISWSLYVLLFYVISSYLFTLFVSLFLPFFPLCPSAGECIPGETVVVDIPIVQVWWSSSLDQAPSEAIGFLEPSRIMRLHWGAKYNKYINK